MNRFKLYCLLLCCSLVCLNGFLPVVSKAYDTENISSIYWEGLEPYCSIFDDDILRGTSDVKIDDTNNDIYLLNNNASSSMNLLTIGHNQSYFDLLYLPDIYDYYMIGTLFGEADNASQFSFYPSTVRLISYPCDGAKGVNLEDLKIYHHDNYGFIGYTFTGKLPNIINTMISYIYMISNSKKSITDNLKCKIYIVRVEKNNAADFDAILSEKLDNINNSINNQGSNLSASIENAMNEINNAIENQYSVSAEEDFGVEDIVNQVNEKAGVLSFGTDTLVNFLDLFDAANATNTKLTFPGFSMKIQGVDYQVWPDYHYDLSELENQFGTLIEVVRWSCVMVVWLAVLNYLVKAYDTIFGR